MDQNYIPPAAALKNYIAPVAHGVLPEAFREILTFLREGAIFSTSDYAAT